MPEYFTRKESINPHLFHFLRTSRDADPPCLVEEYLKQTSPRLLVLVLQPTVLHLLIKMKRDSSLRVILVSISILAWLSPCDGNIPAGNCSESDREALIEFKIGLQDPDNHLSSWQGSNCCGGEE